MSLELIGPVDSLSEGACRGCGYPNTEHTNTFRPKPKKVWKLKLCVNGSSQSESFHLCKKCLWDLRQQMKAMKL